MRLGFPFFTIGVIGYLYRVQMQIFTLTNKTGIIFHLIQRERGAFD
jgi:hypothetical protein